MSKPKISIALVDDHVLITQSLATTINNFGDCRVVLQAKNGKDLQRQMAEGTIPELVILDINMPEMDGYETADWLAENHPEIRVLILTMYDSELAKIRLLLLGVRGFLKKDIEPGMLKEAIVTTMETGFYYPEGKLATTLLRSVDGNIPLDQIVLTPHELQLLSLACSERTYKAIAQEMGHVSVKTLDHWRNSLFGKLHVKSRIGLVVYALENGIIPKK